MMKDSTKMYVIACVFILLNVAGAVALAVGNVNITAYFAFSWLFCMPISLSLWMLGGAWEDAEKEGEQKLLEAGACLKK
jgi:hypothetical protein